MAGGRCPAEDDFEALRKLIIGRGVNRFILEPNFGAAILEHQEGVMKGVHENPRQRELLPAH